MLDVLLLEIEKGEEPRKRKESVISTTLSLSLLSLFEKEVEKMDFNDKDGDMWEWQDEEYCLQGDPVHNFSHCIWDNVNVNANEGNLMCMLEEQTPMKDCADFGYQAYDVVDNSNKVLEECMETSQMKRRRMLQFTSNANEVGIGNYQFTSSCLKSKVREGPLVQNGLSENLEWNSLWNSEPQDDRCTFNSEGWGQQASEGWLVNCLNESEMHCNLNEMDDCPEIDDQIDASEFYNISHEMEQDAPDPLPIKIVKGRNSFLRTPSKLVTPVVYPFALIKPCGVQGDVTLKDINQRIHAPPPSGSEHKMNEDPSMSYPTSAFSGKPVVLKTKIHTKGGKGSITIMRTKG